MYNNIGVFIKVKKIRISEIIKRADSPESRAREEKIRLFVKSQLDYSTGRKRPKDSDEARILERLE